MALDLSRAVLLLPFVDAVWQVYVLIFVINACSAGFTPLFQATIPDVLPDEAVYTRALSLSRLAYDLQQLLAPVLAGVLLWFLPLDALFAVNGAAFLISAALVLGCAARCQEGHPARGRAGQHRLGHPPLSRHAAPGACSRCPWPWPRRPRW